MTRATLIDGKAKAARLATSITADTALLLRNNNVKPGLAVVLVGADPASQVYVRNKTRMAESCGFHSVQHTLTANSTQNEILSVIDSLNGDPAIHGILVQLPLPDQLDEQQVTQSVAPHKDVDGFHFENIGKLTAGHTEDAFVPCTPAGCMLMIEDRHGKDLSGLRAVVIGRSNIVGKPMAMLLTNAGATVTVCHSRTRDLAFHTRRADILVAAVGRPRFITGAMLKPGAVVIDVGINRLTEGAEAGKLCGDVDFASAKEVASLITPVPGGVGPMTITMLLANTVESAERAARTGG
jgi:methylenetetrahydrofolate dehydrogenase (NADP+)/methenyltetrahydrofolate cyclohydrolase